MHGPALSNKERNSFRYLLDKAGPYITACEEGRVPRTASWIITLKLRLYLERRNINVPLF